MTSARTPGGERGASIVEFAVLAPVMVLIVMGVVDLARGYQMQIRLENAAREGAAYAERYPNDVSCAAANDITDRVIAEDGVNTLPEFQVAVFAEDAGGTMTVPLTGCGGTTADSGDRVLVEVSGRFDILTPLVAQAVGGSIDITGSAEVKAR